MDWDKTFNQTVSLWLLFACTLLVMADGGGGGGDGKRSWYEEREISPASDDEKLLLPYVAHALAVEGAGGQVEEKK